MSPDDDMTEIVNADIPRVDLVDKAANGRKFILLKADEDSPNLLTASAVEELLKQAGEPDMTEAAPVEKADADLDVTTVLADPESGMPSGPAENDPSSPEWEAVDAATATKWSGIIARAKHALEILAGRELQESVSEGGDFEDDSNSWDLQDAAAALDYAGDLVSAYAGSEANEAVLSEEVAKAMLAFPVESLEVVESHLGTISKAGRVLSSANETLLKDALSNIQKVVDSLPAAPTDTAAAADVAVSKTEQPEEAAEVTDNIAKDEAGEATDDKDTTGTEGAAPEKAADAAADGVEKSAPVEPAELRLEVNPSMRMYEVQKAMRGTVPGFVPFPADGDQPAFLEKAKGDAMTAVFDQNGKLIGAVKPDAIVPLDGGATDDKPAEPADDVDPEPAADAGTAAAPAAAPAPVAKAEADPIEKSTGELIEEAIAKSAAEIREENAALVKGLEDQIELLKAQPATPRVRSMVPADLRGMDLNTAENGTTIADLKKSLLATSDPAEREVISAALNRAAVAELASTQGRGKPILSN